MSTFTLASSGFAGSNSSCPLHFVNRPRVLETTMWRTLKWIAEWAVSMFHVVMVLRSFLKGSYFLFRSF